MKHIILTLLLALSLAGQAGAAEPMDYFQNRSTLTLSRMVLFDRYGSYTGMTAFRRFQRAVQYLSCTDCHIGDYVACTECHKEAK